MASSELVIPRALYEEMLTHLDAAYPLEACGLLAGQNGTVSQIYAVENLLQSQSAYEMEPRQQLEAMLSMEAHCLELVAIYHSHPSGPEVPSETDVERALYPQAAHVIVSLADRRQPRVRAFTIVESQVDEIMISIV